VELSRAELVFALNPALGLQAGFWWPGYGCAHIC